MIQNMLILDIGCGSVPEGDVNLDLYQGETPHHRYLVKSRTIKNFVNSDAQSLPFRTNSIKILYSSQLLEHLPEPLTHLRECYRVLTKNGWLVIKIPNKPITKESKRHLYSWSETSFKNFLELVFTNVDVKAYTRMGRMETDRLYRLIELIKRPSMWNTLQRVYSQVFNGILIGVCKK